MAIRAKFRISEIAKTRRWNGDGFMLSLRADPVHPQASADPHEDENKRYFAATPAGRLELGCVNHEVLAGFEPGDYIYLTIEKAEVPS